MERFLIKGVDLIAERQTIKAEERAIDVLELTLQIMKGLIKDQLSITAQEWQLVLTRIQDISQKETQDLKENARFNCLMEQVQEIAESKWQLNAFLPQDLEQKYKRNPQDFIKWVYQKAEQSVAEQSDVFFGSWIQQMYGLPFVEKNEVETWIGTIPKSADRFWSIMQLWRYVKAQ